MPQEFNVVIERDADGLFVASVPSLPGCYTQAATRDELMERIREAIALHHTPADSFCFSLQKSRDGMRFRPSP